MARKVDVSDLVGTAEIAQRLGLVESRTVHSWRARYQDSDNPFPEPVAMLRTALIWAWTDVESWARRSGRLEK